MSSTGPRIRYVRAIPNEQWERWVRGNNLPFTAFPADRHCQMTLRWIVKATRRRLGHVSVTPPSTNDTTRET